MSYNSKKAPFLALFALMIVLCGSAGAAVVYETIFETGFEATETPSYVNNTQIHNVGIPTQPWNWTGSDIARVSTAPEATYAGDQGLSSLRSTTGNSRYLYTREPNAFDPRTAFNVRVSLAVKTTGFVAGGEMEIWTQGDTKTGSTADGDKSNRSAWISLIGNGDLRAYTSSSTITVASGLTVTDWNLISMEINLGAHTYDLSLNNSVVASDIPFYGSGADVGTFTKLQIKDYNTGLSTGGFYLDNIQIEGQVVPEPGTLSLMFLALALVSRCRKRS